MVSGRIFQIFGYFSYDCNIGGGWGLVRNAQMSINHFVHKIAFPSPPRKKCQFRGIYTDLYSFSSFWTLFRGGGKTKFCGQEFHGHPDFSDLDREYHLKRWDSESHSSGKF